MLIANESLFLRRTGSMFNLHKRRAKKLKYALRFTLDELRGKARAAVTCPYCGVVLTETNVSMDHRTPIARRLDAWSWSIGNLTAVCHQCNLAKGSLDHEEFAQLMAVVTRLPPQAQASVLGRLKAGNTRIYGRRMWR